MIVITSTPGTKKEEFKGKFRLVQIREAIWQLRYIPFLELRNSTEIQPSLHLTASRQNKKRRKPELFFTIWKSNASYSGSTNVPSVAYFLSRVNKTQSLEQVYLYTYAKTFIQHTTFPNAHRICSDWVWDPNAATPRKKIKKKLKSPSMKRNTKASQTFGGSPKKEDITDKKSEINANIARLNTLLKANPNAPLPKGYKRVRREVEEEVEVEEIVSSRSNGKNQYQGDDDSNYSDDGFQDCPQEDVTEDIAENIALPVIAHILKTKLGISWPVSGKGQRSGIKKNDSTGNGVSTAGRRGKRIVKKKKLVRKVVTVAKFIGGSDKNVKMRSKQERLWHRNASCPIELFFHIPLSSS